MRLLPYGLVSWLVEVDTTAEATSLYDYLHALRPTGAAALITDLIPGARTVLLELDRPGLSRVEVAALLDRWHPGTPSGRTAADVVEIPVRYDGPDLAEVARLRDVSEAAIVEAHTGSEFQVAFCGFVPGFAYISGLPPLLHLPRLEHPRTAVPAGSVALAGGFTGVYPRRSPGGWRLLGHTDTLFWNADREPPTLLAPGSRVRFTAV
ncbi:allophanate hydrolase [Catellatospora methionotrophica]|uniref:Allophanate hydrolase n=1 Tax=Catellatospora methionotrophica TaxID=121620 RepID=A0A8J3PDM3_9ACTN|nr:carboxyltransferase domain-containing protein [Catellatospora methionotrophica]GIG12483.1 allophanate hydrolase [Catellatospora methionotrophica]